MLLYYMEGSLVTTINTLLWHFCGSAESPPRRMNSMTCSSTFGFLGVTPGTTAGLFQALGDSVSLPQGPTSSDQCTLKPLWCSSYRGSLGHAALPAGHPWCFLSCWLGVVLHLPVSFKQSVPFHGHFVRAECPWKALCGLPAKLPLYASVNLYLTLWKSVALNLSVLLHQFDQTQSQRWCRGLGFSRVLLVAHRNT